MKTSEILKKAKSLIDSPEKWAKGHYATDDCGYQVNVMDKRAACFCSVGAVQRATHEGLMRSEQALATLNGRSDKAFATLNRQLKGCSGTFARRNVVDFNDYHTHTEVMDMFDRAIAAAEQEEAL